MAGEELSTLEKLAEEKTTLEEAIESVGEIDTPKSKMLARALRAMMDDLVDFIGRYEAEGSAELESGGISILEQSLEWRERVANAVIKQPV